MKQTRKNIILLVLLGFAASGGGVRAQYYDYYYHRVGDTVEWKAPNGYYSWWELEYFYENNLILYGHTLGLGHYCVDSAIVVQRYYTPTPLKIIGLAGAFNYGTTIQNHGLQNYLMLYDAEPDSFPLLAQVPWNENDPCRYLSFYGHRQRSTSQPPPSDSCCTYNPRHVVLPIHEYYFDSAIYVTDSFYVGGTVYNKMISNTRISPRYPSFGNAGTHIPCDERQAGLECTPIGIVLKEKVHKWELASNCERFGTLPGWNEWGWLYGDLQTSYSNRFCALAIAPAIYPIVEVDTTVPPAGLCLPVANVQVPLVDSGCATVTWDHFPNYTQLELQYGPANAPTSSWTTVDVTGQTLHRLCGLDLPVYGVRLKAKCDKQEMGWSEVVSFYNSYRPDDTTAVIEPGGTALSNLTYLTPNPAGKAVRITSSFNLSRIELYNAAGLLVYSERAAGHEVVVNLDTYPAGNYIVAIKTHNGTTHKKLVVR